MPSTGLSRHHLVFCSDRNTLTYLGITAYHYKRVAMKALNRCGLITTEGVHAE